MADLPKFEPLPNVGNVVSNNVTAFNQGYNLYQCINYLQWYVTIVYENMDALLDDWNNFQQVVNEKISNIATEETQKILNEWLSDGTIANLIKTNTKWDEKLNKNGDTMTGDLILAIASNILSTGGSGNTFKVFESYFDGSTGNFSRYGDENTQMVLNSKNKPIWHSENGDYAILLHDDLVSLQKSIDTLKEYLKKTAFLDPTTIDVLE